MNNPTKLPSAFQLGSSLAEDPPSLGTLVKREPRGSALDQDAAIAKSALDVPALPRTSEANEREAYRRKLVAANRALDGSQFNATTGGAVSGAFVAAGLVLGGLEGALVVGLGVGAWKVVKLLGGRR